MPQFAAFRSDIPCAGGVAAPRVSPSEPAGLRVCRLSVFVDRVVRVPRVRVQRPYGFGSCPLVSPRSSRLRPSSLRSRGRAAGTSRGPGERCCSSRQSPWRPSRSSPTGSSSTGMRCCSWAGCRPSRCGPQRLEPGRSPRMRRSSRPSARCSMPVQPRRHFSPSRGGGRTTSCSLSSPARGSSRGAVSSSTWSAPGLLTTGSSSRSATRMRRGSSLRRRSCSGSVLRPGRRVGVRRWVRPRRRPQPLRCTSPFRGGRSWPRHWGSSCWRSLRARGVSREASRSRRRPPGWPSWSQPWPATSTSPASADASWRASSRSRW